MITRELSSEGASTPLHQGSADEFIEGLCVDAMSHRAVHHPYLRRLASGDLPDVAAAIRDYCHQYYFYSSRFTSYLEAVIGRLESEGHRAVLRKNLMEEHGQDPRNPQSIPHADLFQRFRRAAGVTEAYEARTPPCTAVTTWRDRFLQTCMSQPPCVGLGAIGLGTEMIVPTIYRYLHRAVTDHTEMKPDDFLFLTLHMECDDEHAADMKDISLELCKVSSANREALRLGVSSALDLRAAFWDAMLARAVAA